MTSRPAQSLGDLALYDPEIAIDVGTALIRRIIDRYGTTNPILVAAAYNAGSVTPSTTNPWKYIALAIIQTRPRNGLAMPVK